MENKSDSREKEICTSLLNGEGEHSEMQNTEQPASDASGHATAKISLHDAKASVKDVVHSMEQLTGYLNQISSEFQRLTVHPVNAEQRGADEISGPAMSLYAPILLSDGEMRTKLLKVRAEIKALCQDKFQMQRKVTKLERKLARVQAAHDEAKVFLENRVNDLGIKVKTLETCLSHRSRPQGETSTPVGPGQNFGGMFVTS